MREPTASFACLSDLEQLREPTVSRVYVAEGWTCLYSVFHHAFSFSCPSTSLAPWLLSCTDVIQLAQADCMGEVWDESKMADADQDSQTALWHSRLFVCQRLNW